MLLTINKEEKTTIFLTSHDVGDIESLCERTIIVNRGTVIKDLPTADLAKSFAFEKYIDLIPTDKFLSFAELPAGIRYLNREPNKITIAVNTDKTSTKDALNAMLDLYDIEDIDVYNADTETVIRHIYERTASRADHN